MAQRGLEAIQLETQIAAFDIYATTLERYSVLGHAQRQVKLAQDAVDLAADIAESARARVDMGAAMQSELLLGQLEIETAELELAEANSEMDIAGTELTSLWQGQSSDIVVAQTDFDPAVVARVDALRLLLEGNRAVRSLEAEAALTEAELDLERSGAKPNLSLSGGYRRIETNSSNSFVFGIGLPLPFLNRNQGSIRSLEARLDAIRFSRKQALVTATAEFETSKRRIEQQVSRYRIINTKVLPKAQETYLSLKSAYDKGKLPYSTLIEAQRLLLDLRFELNDIGLTIELETVALERLLGVTI
jgi:cobalt-zinc-cadmium efflux system outer membrane protein